MSSPRHLWSGDWELDSAAAAEELAARRAQIEEPSAIAHEVSAPRAQRPAAAPAGARWRDARRLTARARPAAARIVRSFEFRAALVVAVLVLLTAGIAFGTTLLLNGSSAQGSTNLAHTWLGVDVAGSPSGIVVTHVVPGSPAQAAGLQPGDLIDEINQQPVATVDGVSAALNGMQGGDQIEIQFTRGVAIFATTATLGAHPPASP